MRPAPKEKRNIGLAWHSVNQHRHNHRNEAVYSRCTAALPIHRSTGYDGPDGYFLKNTKHHSSHVTATRASDVLDRKNCRKQCSRGACVRCRQSSNETKTESGQGQPASTHLPYSALRRPAYRRPAAQLRIVCTELLVAAWVMSACVQPPPSVAATNDARD